MKKKADFRAFMEQANAEDREKRTGVRAPGRKRIKVRAAKLPPNPATSHRSTPP